MKKFLLIFLLLAVAGSYYFYKSQNSVNIKNVAQMNLYEYGSEVPFDSLSDIDGSDAEFLSEVINSSVKRKNLSSGVVGDKSFNIEFIMENGNSSSFFIHFDEGEKSAKISDSSMNNFYTVPEEFVTSLLVNHYFESIYTYYRPPFIDFKLNDESLYNFDSQFEWSFKKADGNWYKSENLEPNVQISEESLKLNPSDIISIKYDFIPDESVLKIYKEDEIIYEEPLNSLEFSPPGYEGDFKYVVSSHWNNEKYKGSCDISFLCSMNVTPEFYVGVSDSTRGDVFFIVGKYIDDDEKIMMSQNINKKKFRIYESK